VWENLEIDVFPRCRWIKRKCWSISCHVRLGNPSVWRIPTFSRNLAEFLHAFFLCLSRIVLTAGSLFAITSLTHAFGLFLWILSRVFSWAFSLEAGKWHLVCWCLPPCRLRYFLAFVDASTRRSGKKNVCVDRNRGKKMYICCVLSVVEKRSAVGKWRTDKFWTKSLKLTWSLM
jgi:hypothetical protein